MGPNYGKNFVFCFAGHVEWLLLKCLELNCTLFFVLLGYVAALCQIDKLISRAGERNVCTILRPN